MATRRSPARWALSAELHTQTLHELQGRADDHGNHEGATLAQVAGETVALMAATEDPAVLVRTLITLGLARPQGTGYWVDKAAVQVTVADLQRLAGVCS